MPIDEAPELTKVVICWLEYHKGRKVFVTNQGMEKVNAFALGLVIEMSAMQKSATPSITLIMILTMMMFRCIKSSRL